MTTTQSKNFESKKIIFDKTLLSNVFQKLKKYNYGLIILQIMKKLNGDC